MNEPFRSRPKVTRDPPEEDLPIIDGVIEEIPPEESYANNYEDDYEYLAYEIDDEEIESPPPPVARPTPKRRRGVKLAKPGLFLIALALVAVGIFFTLLNIVDFSDEVLEWWPAVTLGIAGLWSLVALIRRDSTAFLGGAGVAAISISLLLDAQSVAEFHETVVGIILIMLGVAVVVRGLLMRPRRRTA